MSAGGEEMMYDEFKASLFAKDAEIERLNLELAHIKNVVRGRDFKLREQERLIVELAEHLPENTYDRRRLKMQVREREMTKE